jgi:glycosyltransferase involved in cell wall biosynthesis
MTMIERPKILYVSHNHPAVRPGGAEAYALELYEAMRAGGDFEPLLLARTGPPISKARRYHEGTLFTSLDGDPSQYFFYTDRSKFDWLHLSSEDKTIFTRHYRDFLLAHRPDIVHFQHTLYLGIEMITETRNTLRDAPILYTLHEFGPICNRHGQMVRTGSDELCTHESPRRCHECFPDVSPQEFFLRKRFIQAHLSGVDLFLAPSRFLRDRYVAWGVPPEKIVVEDYGRNPPPVTRRPDADSGRMRNRLGYFGQLIPFKGVTVLLRAMKQLADERIDAHLWVYGANLDLQPQDFQDEFRDLLAASSNVTHSGAYLQDELPQLMAGIDWVVVPSVWWENSPLVIQEAFQHRRPVICSDIGGMAEKVTHGVDGLHFRVGDSVDLARVIRETRESPDLWSTLQAGITGPHSMQAHLASLTREYRRLLRARRGELATA